MLITNAPTYALVDLLGIRCQNDEEKERENECCPMSTYWLLYISASNVIDDDDEKFLKRNRKERKNIALISTHKIIFIRPNGHIFLHNT
jgi:hypothetical protein